ncbi:uncharacterized protein LOC102082595 isoform X3 [Oreochromis niloticus]|uniref:Uncharacterized LOC102082595 n=1 Tax=Oreochromis niloticus TaxID=8128 RepID=I3J651_ORENI|nr:uncharacterized protein LOC102082595 isoform X3 [Oreochromis niloticus]
MQRYLWPGYEVQLLGGLQRQQNSAQFCDTLLQTEGISIPTHSCVLAALSPYLSQKLSASPSPPSGQKRQLQLQTVKAQTLLKLVGLLYSGVLEVKGNNEKSDVLAAAHQFGITDLVRGQKGGGPKEVQERRPSLGNCRERWGSLKIQETHVEAEVAGTGEENSPVRKKICVSVGTQTVTIVENSVDFGNPEPASSVAQSPDVCVTVPHLTPRPTVPSDGESTFGQTCDSVTNPTSTSSFSIDTVPFPTIRNDSSSSEAQDDCYQESSESGDGVRWLARERAGLEDGKSNGTAAENERNAEQPRQVCRDEMNKKQNSSERSPSQCSTAVKDLTKMKEMMEDAQISIKVKLRRRTTGEMWEVVKVQSPDETSVLTSLTQPQTDAEELEPPPSPVHPCPVQKPEIQNLPPAVTSSPTQPEQHHNTTSESQSLSTSCFTSNPNSEVESAPAPQPQGSVDECDEQIEKLLEDVMMSLNILPNFEGNCKKLESSHNVCRVPVSQGDAAQSRMDPVTSAAECAFFQDLESQSNQTSVDTGIHCCFAGPNQPKLIQQQQPPTLQCNSAVRSLWQIDGLSCQGLPPFKRKYSLYPETPTGSVLSSAFFTRGQKLHYPAFQPPSSQDDQHSLEFLPLPNGNGTQSEPTFSSPCMDDLRLPQRLSPLEPSTSAAKGQPLLNNSANPKQGVQQQPSLRRRPWLSDNAGLLQFPFSSIICMGHKNTSPSPDPDHSCQSKQEQQEKDSHLKNGGTSAEGCKGNSLKERGKKSAAEVKSYSRRLKESFKYRHDDTTGDGRKRRRTNDQQDSTGSCSAYKDLKVSDGTKDCSVSLSSNNVLLKEREETIRSSNAPSGLPGKPSKMSPVIDNGGEKPFGTKPSRIRTRAFIKKSQEAANNTTPPETPCIFKPVVSRARLVNQDGVLHAKRKRGRPRKIRPVEESSESVPAIVENNENGDNAQVDRNLPKEQEEKKMEKTCRKRRRNESEVEVSPVKKTASVEHTEKAEEMNACDVKPGTVNQRHMVTLKDIQKLIKWQHARRMKSKQTQETHEPVKGTDGILKKGADIKDGTNSEEHHKGSNIAVDKNHNLLLSPSAETNGRMSEKRSLDGDEDHPVSLDVVEEDEAKVTTERERPLGRPDEGKSDTTGSPFLNDDCSSHSDTLLPEENTALDLLHPLTVKITSTDKKGKEEEEEEVDVLVCSPEKAPQTRECEGFLNNIDMTPNEDEEDDVNEIDVTGDEAE